MATPFGEEDMSTDVKTRVSNRQVEWGILREVNCSPQGKRVTQPTPLSVTHNIYR